MVFQINTIDIFFMIVISTFIIVALNELLQVWKII